MQVNDVVLIHIPESRMTTVAWFVVLIVVLLVMKARPSRVRLLASL